MTLEAPSKVKHLLHVTEQQANPLAKREKDQPKAVSDGDGELVLFANGLPWSATKGDVVEFFKGCDTKMVVIPMSSKRGRHSGTAYVEFTDNDSYRNALQKAGHKMGNRYIEISKSSRSELDLAAENLSALDEDGVVFIQGLPFTAKAEQIQKFFDGLNVVKVVICRNPRTGSSIGEAFVQFASSADAHLALQRNKKKMGQRYIDVFRSTMEAMDARQSRELHAPRFCSGHRDKEVQVSEESLDLFPAKVRLAEDNGQWAQTGEDCRETCRGECGICKAAHVDAVLLPCRHAALCFHCAQEIRTAQQGRLNFCPFCRGRIDRIIRIRWLRIFSFPSA